MIRPFKTIGPTALATALLALVPSFAPAQAEVPSVVTDFTPVTSLVAMVMGDLGAPVQMLDKGADPHDFALLFQFTQQAGNRDTSRPRHFCQSLVRQPKI